jgi:predicted nucleic acid-binding Zn ribbon protein
MEAPLVPSQVPPESVRTPVVGSRWCPVCEVAELRSRQTVCSATCRRERSRRREAERIRVRDREIRGLLEAALRKLKDGAP